MPRTSEITIYRRHNEDCPDRDDRYAPRCGCALWFQYQFDGKQRQHGSRARTFTEAQRNATELPGTSWKPGNHSKTTFRHHGRACHGRMAEGQGTGWQE